MSRVFWRACVVSLGLAAPAAAQEGGDEIARRTLIEQAEGARAAGDHARALDLAQRAGAIRMTTSVRQIIAYEHEAVGHTLEALDDAEGCAREARTDTALRNRGQILAACDTLARTLRARVAWVTVRVPRPPPPGLRVTVDGREVRPALWGVAWPALPGAFAVVATAEGVRFHRVVSAAAGAQVEAVVDPTPGAPAAPAPTASPSADAPWTGGAGPWILAGAGALTLGAAGAFAALRSGALDARTEADDDDREAEANAENVRFRTFTVLTNMALGVGASALVAAVSWYALDRRGAAVPVTVAVSPSRSGAMVSVGGSL